MLGEPRGKPVEPVQGRLGESEAVQPRRQFANVIRALLRVFFRFAKKGFETRTLPGVQEGQMNDPVAERNLLVGEDLL